MTSIFRPKMPTPEPAAAPPTIDEAAKASDYMDRLRRRRGRASTILVPDGAQPAAKSILGAP